MHISCALNSYTDKMVNVNNDIFRVEIDEQYHIFFLFFIYMYDGGSAAQSTFRFNNECLYLSRRIS